MITIKRALISVSDKKGIVDFAKHLLKYNVEIISTGGTYKLLKDNNIPAKSIEEVTNFPEILGGRVKTLHPVIHAGLLARLDYPDHVKTLESLNINKIDLVVVNLYPFAQTRLALENSQKDKEEIHETIIENIDIGGPSMLRSAAKNYMHTVVVSDPSDYLPIMIELEGLKGQISKHTSRKLAAKVFRLTSAYDAMIADYFNHELKEEFPEILTIPLINVLSLRYGENPHQQAAFYRPLLEYYKDKEYPLGFNQLQGKELSFNNILDLTAAMQCAVSLPYYGVVIVKHLNPSGAAYAKSEDEILEAFLSARDCDPISAFGGIIAVNGPVDKELAIKMTEQFMECVIAKSYTSEALEVFSQKSNIRVIEYKNPEKLICPRKEIRVGLDGYLYQDMDNTYNYRSKWKVVTQKQPTEEDWEGLEFAWRVVKYVKSNAVIFTSKNATLAIGAGQMSRVDSVEFAVHKAIKMGISLKDSYVASDAFFPFKDGVEIAAKVGAKAIIQPGGSIRDQEVIDTANHFGIAMVFTGMRHFRH
jgi:phosphoribosylaminoimidazolecarboxamide formyltransferase/IMP cyclohydrolase